MAKVVIGIDPGGKGAIALMIDGKLEDVFDMPADKVLTGKSKRTRVNAASVAVLLLSFPTAYNPGDSMHVFIENVSSMPKEGVASAFAFGKACGIVEGAVAACGFSYTMVTPQTWKKAVGMPRGKDKNAARRRAGQLFPELAQKFARVKDDGRSEAALLAYYGWRQQPPQQGRRKLRQPTNKGA